jgi:cytoskeleton protein RodZ
VESGIGTTLREARNRRKVDLSEVEKVTKIRVRYLRAIENEEWDVLPGDIYARAFIRTYAAYLGLDGERLAEDYRSGAEAGGQERPAPRVEPAWTGHRTPAHSRSRGRVLVVVVVAALIGVLVAFGLASSGDDSAGEKSKPSGAGSEQSQAPSPAQTPGVAVSIEATEEVWVCLLDAREQPLVGGRILAPGAQEGPFRSNAFTVAFGNGAVEMEIDGSPAPIPDSSSPLGFAVDSDGVLTELEEGERPDCE